MTRRYELSLTPEEATEHFKCSEAAARLARGELVVLGRPLDGGWAIDQQTVRLCAVVGRPRSRTTSFEVLLTLPLQRTEVGASFEVRRSTWWSTVTELRRAATFAMITVGILAIMYWPVALVEAMIFALIVLVAWAGDRRALAAARSELLGVVWQAWSSVLVGKGLQGYRELPKPRQ